MNAKPVSQRTAPAVQRGPMPRQPWIGVIPSLRAALRGRLVDADAPWRADALAEQQEGQQDWQRAAIHRRRWLMLWIFGATALATGLLWRGQAGQGLPSPLQGLQMALFALLFAWVSAGCVTAAMGFWVLVRGDRHALSAKDAAHVRLGRDARTAVIMPICNEDVPTVFAGLRATCESLASTGAQRLFEVFVLSDSSDPALIATERAAWAQLRDHMKAQAAIPGTELQVHYRVRKVRTRRKAGNVADFCRRWGRAFKYMVVLDADSVMTGDALVTLARLMEAHPRAGIIQTAPRPCGLDTMHARAQQFAAQVAGRLFTAGVQFWQLGEAHYWGHNAIIRVQPFMQHCGLASLPGDGALGGDILSHDFVEAALMRRAGYHVWLVNDLVGSYEQQPPHVLAELQRDRRWCQGNLQNARLIAEPGLHAVHRGMLATGAMAYLSAPLWLLYVVLGVAVWLVEGHTMPQAAAVLSPRDMAGLWAVTGLMLALPRVLGLVAVFMRGEQALHGGALRLVGSSLMEAVLSTLQAPLRMAAHSLFVVGALTGWKLEWKSPPREAQDLAWREAFARFAPLGVAAVVVQLVMTQVSPSAAVWLLPMVAPLVLAVPIAVISSRQRLGLGLRHAQWLMIAEETQVPGVLTRAWQLARQFTLQQRPEPIVPTWRVAA